jgi:hypothetical protein
VLASGGSLEVATRGQHYQLPRFGPKSAVYD